MAGLAVGVGFIMLLSINPLHYNLPGSVTNEELERIFGRAESLQEVQLFLDKYPDALKGFSRSQGQITDEYTAARWLDLDGDGNRETFRQLTLSVTFDGTGNDPEPLNIVASCAAASQADRRLTSLESPAYDGDVMAYLHDSTCIPIDVE